jgi:hypothetical protein
MLKIQRSANGSVVFTLSGRIEAEDVKELRQLLTLEKTAQDVVLDLRDVTLVNQDAVKFLAGCEADSIKLENCPAYSKPPGIRTLWDQRGSSIKSLSFNLRSDN